jgi:transposase
MITIGVDYHKRTSSYCVLNETGQKVKSVKLENTTENIRNFLQSLDGPKQLAMEATRNWGLFYDTSHDLVDQFYLGHPKKMKAITESETKNDQKDAETIAKLLQSRFFPQAHVSLLNTRQLRSLLRFRHFLATQRASLRHQVHILIDRNLWPKERPKNFKSLFCQRGRQWLEAVDLPQRERFILNQCLENIDQLTYNIQDLEIFIQQQTLNLPGLKYLRTIPGFMLSKINAFIVLLEIDDVHRFAKARRLAHYAGLIPREHSSADKHRTGRLVKGANLFLRTAFIESTLAAIRMDKGLKQYYKSVKANAGSSAAIVACARKLAYAVYYVLKEQRPYRLASFNPPAAVYSASAVPALQG